jgi:restriction system protein
MQRSFTADLVLTELARVIAQGRSMRSAEYEDFIYGVCRALGEAAGAAVHRDRIFRGRISGREIKVEVSFETQLLGARILGLVECKCYKSRVEVSDVEEFHSKIDDIGAHKGIMFTTVGYEAGAVKVAKGRGIALFTLRERQEPSEIRVETRAAGPKKRGLVKGNFRPWGRFSESRDDPGFRVESAGEMFYILALSMVEVLDELVRQQRAK